MTVEDPESLTFNTVAHMRDAVFFEGDARRQRTTRFWILLVLAAVIATAGVIAGSDATVIGAMIVAPMMIPIQGAMLATVLGDRDNLLRSIALIVAGALTAIAIGFVVALFDPLPVTAANNAEVASRVNPGLIDMLAALATGVVGSVALVRRDISDTLPGVAIAISLVPPLCVVGVTLQSAAYTEALGALLLFVTNVAAILATGVVVMSVYHVPGALTTHRVGDRRRRVPRAVVVIAGMMIVVLIPLTVSTIGYVGNALEQSRLQSVGAQWAADQGWQLVSSDVTGAEAKLSFAGPPPVPSTSGLTSSLKDAGITQQVEVEFVPTYTHRLETGS